MLASPKLKFDSYLAAGAVSRHRPFGLCNDVDVLALCTAAPCRLVTRDFRQP